MANGFSSFKSDHHYATGIILVTVGIIGAYGAVTGFLPSMLAALWVPEVLESSDGSSAASSKATPSPVSEANTVAGKILQFNPITGPLEWAASHL